MTATSDEAALLKAIIAAPEEDTPRLAYADEIEDRDPERAEFIRVQCYLHDAEADPANLVAVEEYKAARKRERERECWPESEGLPWANSWQWQRGFICEVVCDPEDWFEYGDKTRSRHPVTKVVLLTLPRTRTDLKYTAQLECKFIAEVAGVVVETGHVEAGENPWYQLLEKRWPGVEFVLPTPRQQWDNMIHVLGVSLGGPVPAGQLVGVNAAGQVVP